MGRDRDPKRARVQRWRFEIVPFVSGFIGALPGPDPLRYSRDPEHSTANPPASVIMKSLTCTAAALAVFASSASAQFTEFRLNEIYISQTGDDDQEFIEIVGPAGVFLTNLMVLAVEGEGASAIPGELEFAYDLSGSLMFDNYFVVGDAPVAGVDFAPVLANLLENGTQTIYLLEANDPAAVQALVGTSVEIGGTNDTIIPTLGTILDSVAITTGDCTPFCIPTPGDKTYDNAPVLGPDFTFVPAGIYRGEDFPNDWCVFDYLDFNDEFNVTMPRSPGFKNYLCAANPPMDASPGSSPFISLAAGGSQSWQIDLGPAQGGQLYWIGGTFSGPFPGVPLAIDILMPLNFDAYLVSRLNKPFGGPLTFGVGGLGGSGTSAFSSFGIPPGTDPTLAGLTLHHSVVSFDATNMPTFASNAVPVFLVP